LLLRRRRHGTAHRPLGDRQTAGLRQPAEGYRGPCRGWPGARWVVGGGRVRHSRLHRRPKRHRDGAVPDRADSRDARRARRCERRGPSGQRCGPGPRSTV
ncbi:MAG: hypothetical protein AVDCRST_MAG70-2544, partial [uncultured Thermomicrobiales bacterium]